MSYEYDYSDQMAFEQQRTYESSRKRKVAGQPAPVKRNRHLPQRLILVVVLLAALGLLELIILQVSGIATAVHAGTIKRQHVITVAQPVVVATTATTVVDIVELSSFESAIHTAGTFPVVPRRFPDANLGTEDATNTTGTLFIIE